MRVKSRRVWNLGSAWLWSSTMLRMSSSSRGRCSSAGLRRRRWKASTQVMPVRSSCVPLRIVSRFQPRWASAQTCPPRPIALTVLAMKSRRWLDLSALAASIRMGIISGEGRISVFLEAPGVEASSYRAVFSFQAPKELDLDPDDARRMATSLREGIVQRKPEVTLSGEVECDEAYVVAGHKGHPEAVRKKGEKADADV